MKRFAVLTEWNDSIAEDIRLKYKKRYGIDLRRYISQKEDDFDKKWESI